jgi:hypothetical protein
VCVVLAAGADRRTINAGQGRDFHLVCLGGKEGGREGGREETR